MVATDLLNEALGVKYFQRQAYRKLRIDLWHNKPIYPRELLHWDECLTTITFRHQRQLESAICIPV